ncbi:MAG: lysophospholipid acyltransferase family protein [Melioribacteraceae bacterium]|nr:lysophospholipid acyltransferase family protein [Melioribacteraceae bacterium]
MKHDILQKIGLVVLPKILSIYLKTLRIEKSELLKLKRNYEVEINPVFTFWHSKMFAGWYINRSNKSAALVSKSKDGELLTRILKNWNYKITRGSSHKGGKEALGEMINLIEKGYSLCITPDGPTGPPQKMKAGCVIAAKKTSVPLVLIGIGYSQKIRLNSWDRMEIPLPFSKVVVLFDEPIYVNKDLTYDETSQIIINAEEKLNRINYQAEKIAKGA